MGQKCNPNSFRVERSICSWWYAKNPKEYSEYLLEDYKIRQFINQKFSSAMISVIDIKRLKGGDLMIKIHVAKSGQTIRNKASIDLIKDYILSLNKTRNKVDFEISIEVIDIKSQDTDAITVAMKIARHIENRGSVKKIMKNSAQSAMKLGAKGIKILISGRINGAEIARDESYLEGKVPLHTIRANIKFSHCNALTTYGIIGVKVWIYMGDN